MEIWAIYPNFEVKKTAQRDIQKPAMDRIL